MSQLKDPRAAYWNQTYQKYWEERVAETERENGASIVLKGDARTEGDWVYERVFNEHPFKPGNILDVGCAWGRMFSIYQTHGLDISGVDISSSMIESAQANLRGSSGIDRLEVAMAENLPFDDNYFDNLVCVAVFDATYQHQALVEFLRVLKPGGHLYVTGKCDSYAIDDELAFAAEIGARSKGHPNFFTDVSAMRGALISFGCEEMETYAFARRGDFADFEYTKNLDKPFYEWFMILKNPKTKPTIKLDKFSSKFSKTFFVRETENEKS